MSFVQFINYSSLGTSPTKRTNHAADESNMVKAVNEWLFIKDMPYAPPKAEFARTNQVNPSTFKKYVCNDPAMCHKLGGHAGRPSVVSEENSQFLMEHTIRADCANDGLPPQAIIQNIMTLHPELSHQQADNHYHKTFIKKHVGQLKQKNGQGSKDYIIANIL